MSARLRKTLVGSAVVLTTLIAVGFLLVDDEDRMTWFTVWAPLTLAVAVLSDYFIWQNPKRVERREREKDRPRYGE